MPSPSAIIRSHSSWPGTKTQRPALQLWRGRPQTIFAMLQPSLSAGVVRREIATDVTLQHITLQTLVVNVTRIPVSTTETGTIDCPTGYTCMPELLAESNYGAGNYNRYSPTPCGWTQVTQPSQPTVEYCFAKKPASVKQVVTGPVALQTIRVNTAGAGGENPVPAGEPLQPMKEDALVITHIGVIDSFLGTVFGGLFGNTPAKPKLNVTLVGPTLVPGLNYTQSSYYAVAPRIGPARTGLYRGAGPGPYRRTLRCCKQPARVHATQYYYRRLAVICDHVRHHPYHADQNSQPHQPVYVHDYRSHHLRGICRLPVVPDQSSDRGCCHGKPGLQCHGPVPFPDGEKLPR